MILLSIIVFLIIFVMLLIVDFQLGKKKYESNVPVFEFEKQRGDYNLFSNGYEFFDTLFQDIKEARFQIDMQFFVVKTDEISQQLLTLLKEKALEGVKVRFLVDRIGGHSLHKKVIDDLRSHDVTFTFSDTPSFPFFFYRLNRRNHRKITIIDEKIGYLGGFNVGKEYLGKDPKLGPWRDYHLRITGEVVQGLTTVFVYDWQTAANQNNEKPTKTRAAVSPLGEQILELIVTEGGQLEKTLVERIKMAKDEILIGSPYFIPSKSLYEELVNALHRGVDISLLIPMKSDHLFVKEAGMPFYRDFFRKGANVYLFDNGFYHAKVMVIDQKLCDMGTANFDMRSLFLNKECSVVIRQDEAFIQSVRDSFLTDTHESYPLNEKWIQQRSIRTKIKEQVAKWIRPLL